MVKLIDNAERQSRLLKGIPLEWNKSISRILEKSVDEWKIEVQADLEFSMNKLDDACAMQSQYYGKYAGHSATSSKFRNFKELELDELKSKIQADVRNKPDKYNITEDEKGKLREAEVKAAVTLDEEVKQLSRDYYEAVEYAKFFNKAVEAFEQKNWMLRLAGDLWLGEYHSSISIKGKEEDDFREKMKGRKRRRLNV